MERRSKIQRRVNYERRLKRKLIRLPLAVSRAATFRRYTLHITYPTDGFL